MNPPMSVFKYMVSYSQSQYLWSHRISLTSRAYILNKEIKEGGTPQIKGCSYLIYGINIQMAEGLIHVVARDNPSGL